LNEKKVSRCSVNAALGREREFRIVPTLKPLSVMVVGGGPAGLESARIAALRGHAVSLYEKDQELGGQLILSARPPYKDEIRKFREYLVRQVGKAGVEIKLGIEVTEATVKAVTPDVVILATGVLPLCPEIPGALGHNVVTAWDVLAGKKVGKRVVISGGGMVGCETAEYLLERGHKVSIVEMLSQIASDLEPYTVRKILLQRLSKYDGLDILVNSQVERITGKGLVVKQNGDEKLVDANSVVLAMGAVPNSILARKLRHIIPNLFVIGDCSKAGRIEDAINQAAWVARQI
jgi:NADPH-dependent 2,4-dienoyl-CoA reductase/sulfur reductase-like enzyme